MNRLMGSFAVVTALGAILVLSEGVAAQSLILGAPTLVSGVSQPVPTVVRQVTQPLPTAIPPPPTIAPRVIAPTVPPAPTIAPQQISTPVPSSAGTSGGPVVPPAGGATSGGSDVTSSGAGPVSSSTGVIDPVTSAPVAAPIVNSAAGEASSVIDSAAGAAAAMGDPVQQVVAPAAAAVQPAVSSVTNVLQPAADRAPVSPDTVGTPDEETAGPDGAPPDEPAAADTGEGRPGGRTHAAAAVSADSGPAAVSDPATAAAESQTAAASDVTSTDQRGAAAQAQLAQSETDLSLDAGVAVTETMFEAGASVDESALDSATNLTFADPASLDDAPTLALLPPGSPLLAALSGAELAYLLAQCGPHPEFGTPGCDRGLPPPPIQPTAEPVIETAGSQFAPEPAPPPNPVQAAANAVSNIVTSGLARTGVPDVSVLILILATMLVIGIGLRRMGKLQVVLRESNDRPE